MHLSSVQKVGLVRSSPLLVEHPASTVLYPLFAPPLPHASEMMLTRSIPSVSVSKSVSRRQAVVVRAEEAAAPAAAPAPAAAKKVIEKKPWVQPTLNPGLLSPKLLTVLCSGTRKLVFSQLRDALS